MGLLSKILAKQFFGVFDRLVVIVVHGTYDQLWAVDVFDFLFRVVDFQRRRIVAPVRTLSAASQSIAAARTEVRCCAASPGFFLFARIFSMRTGRPVMTARLSVLRRICPPPSPWEPSIIRISVKCIMNDLY